MGVLRKGGIWGVTSPDIQPSLSRIGWIAKGAMEETVGKDGTKRQQMVERPEFRFSSQNPQAVKAFREAYGDKPTELEVVFPFNLDSIFWSAYVLKGTGGSFNRVCDGKHIYQERGKDNVLRDVEKPCLGDACKIERQKGEQGPPQCRMLATLDFVLLDPRDGSYLFGYNTVTMNLSSIDFVGEGKIYSTLLGQQQINGGTTAGVRATLFRKEVVLKARFNKHTWPVQIYYHPPTTPKPAPQQLAAGMPETAIIEQLPSNIGGSDLDDGSVPQHSEVIVFRAESVATTKTKSGKNQFMVKVPSNNATAFCIGDDIEEAFSDPDGLYNVDNFQFVQGKASVHVFNEYEEPPMLVSVKPVTTEDGRQQWVIVGMQPDYDWFDGSDDVPPPHVEESTDEPSGVQDEDFEDAEELPTLVEMGFSKTEAAWLASTLQSSGKYDEGYNLLYQQFLIRDGDALDFKAMKILLEEQGVIEKGSKLNGGSKKAAAPTKN